MRENLKKRLSVIEETSEPTKPMVICCPANGNVEELVAEWGARYGDCLTDVPLLIIRDASQRQKTAEES